MVNDINNVAVILEQFRELQRLRRFANDVRVMMAAQQRDAVIVSASARFPVHRMLVSARSPVFAACFNWPGNINNEVDLRFVDDTTCQALIRYLETGQGEEEESDDVFDWTRPPPFQLLAQLLQLGDFLLLPELKDYCQQMLSAVLTVIPEQLFPEIAAVAVDHGCDRLRQACRQHLQRFAIHHPALVAESPVFSLL